MPKNLFEEIVFTVIMAACMVYGMVVYNIMINMGGFTPAAFGLAFHELPIMGVIAFILEFFIVGKIAKMVAFKFVKPTDGRLKITCAISTCICLIMCPTMSLIATFLFQDPSLLTFLRTWAFNLPMALAYQLILCGPVVRTAFGLMFRSKAPAEMAD